jgi:hypothetical protein
MARLLWPAVATKPAERFELAEEALDDVALLVEIGVVRTLIFPVSLWWNDDCGLPLNSLVDEMIGVIAFVGNCALCLEAVDAVMRIGDVVALPRLAIRRTGSPSASPAAWILVLRPPRDRPTPWECARLLTGAPAAC